MRRCFLILFVSSSMCISHSLLLGQQQKKPLSSSISIKLQLEKQKYYKSEVAWLDVEIKNLLDQTVAIPEPWYMGELRIDVRDEHGERIPRWFNIESLGDTFDTLSAFETRFTAASLGGFGNDTSDDRGGPELLPGTYTVSATLGDAQSNVVRFEVLDPPPSENAARKKLIDLIKSRSTVEEKIERAKHLLSEHPQSVYFGAIYFEYLVSLKVSSNSGKNVDQLSQAALDFFRTFPDAVACEHVVRYYQSAMEQSYKAPGENKTSAAALSIRARLQNLQLQYSGKRVSKYAKQLLGDLEHHAKQVN